MANPISTETSPATSTTIPRTPRPPFSPPRRSSSLAFSRDRRTVISPLGQQGGASTHATALSNSLQPNVGRKRVFASPVTHDAPSPVHVAQMQRIFQAAKATLHRDMFAASSPASSIESRMNLDQDSPIRIPAVANPVPENQEDDVDTKAWRYSTAPLDLAAISADVREPLPSPTMPDSTLKELGNGSEGVEPVSSGFTSPNALPSMFNIYEAVATMLPASNGGRRIMSIYRSSLDDTDYANEVQETELEKPLNQLRVSTDESADESGQESPIVTHLKRRSLGMSKDFGVPSSPEREFYLSPTAEAAANSAKAKRKLLKELSNTGEEDDNKAYALPTDYTGIRYLEPNGHYIKANTLHPDLALHYPSPALVRRPMLRLSNDMVMLDRDSHVLTDQPMLLPATSRATSTGSPMPFVRTRLRPETAQEGTLHPRMTASQYQREIYMNNLNEHFQPGWYYAAEQIRSSPRTAYSFSTATSKVVGADPAPDSQMRDSYKTDTLTALPKSSARYRKNGIGAEVVPRGVTRYYQRPPPSMRPQGAKSRPSSRQTYASGSEVRFRSSPPRAPEPYMPIRRKRAMDDSFMVAKDVRVRDEGPALMLRESDDMIEVNEQTKAAVRMSIFGTNTPEALRQARQGIKELSPNVQVFRKGTQEHAHLRKKRRPSYWDNDLKEVRESPAGRGGVNSPVSAQASMRAEFEIASLGNTEMDLDDDDLTGEVTRAGMNLENRLSGYRTETNVIPSNAY